MTITPSIRVLHVFGMLNKGGAETRTMDIYRTINKSQIQFDFVVHTNEKCFYDDEIVSMGGIVYKGIPRFEFFNVFSYYKIWKAFFKNNPYNIIHIHTTNSALPILIAAKKQNIKVRIAHARIADENSFLRRAFVALNRYPIRKFSTYMLAVSEIAGEFAFGKNFSVIPNAIDAGKLRYNINSRKTIRNELGIEDCFVIGNVARFHFQKNHLFLLDAFKEVKGTVPNAKLLLVGTGELKDIIQAKIDELEINDSVMLLGVRDDVEKLLSAMDIFALPSHYEGLPGVALEAQAAGLKTLISDKITKEAAIVDELVEFLKIDEGVSSWVNKIVDFYQNVNYDRRDTYDNFVEAGYDIKSVASWYEKFYIETCIEQKSWNIRL